MKNPLTICEAEFQCGGSSKMTVSNIIVHCSLGQRPGSLREMLYHASQYKKNDYNCTQCVGHLAFDAINVLIQSCSDAFLLFACTFGV